MHNRRPLARYFLSLVLLVAVAALVGCAGSHRAGDATPATRPSTSTSASGTASSPPSAVIVRRLPSHVVAKVGRTAIRDADLKTLLSESKRAARKRHLPFAAGSVAYRRARAQALHQLVVDAALEQAATRLGVVVTDGALTKRLRMVEVDSAGIDPEDEEATQAEIDRKFAKRLKALGMTKASVLSSLKMQLLMAGLYEKVTAHVRPATPQAKAAAMQRWTRDFNSRLARKVVYQSGYAPPRS